jgi:hypothetical protein
MRHVGEVSGDRVVAARTACEGLNEDKKNPIVLDFLRKQFWRDKAGAQRVAESYG